MDEQKTNTEAVKREITPGEVGEMIRQIDAAKAIFEKYAVYLTPAERQHLVGSNVRNIGFIQASFLSAESHHTLLPQYLPITKYREDKENFERKRTLLAVVNGFAQEISDSMLESSDVVYHDSLAYYNTIKEAAKQHVADAETEFNALKIYFDKHKSQSPEPTEAQLEHDFHSLLHGTKEGSIYVKKDVPAVEHSKLTVEDNVHSPHETVSETVKKKEKSE
ncbi:MAG: hypothetical protein LBJ17_08115 [Dysgonamonadaceae bacterium]|jgi:hypothetical protein|nr:hypothetical protein [Dysgonamonadaceae bacterium]